MDTYSLNFTDEDDPVGDDSMKLEWNCHIESQWTETISGFGAKWGPPSSNLDNWGHSALLAHFGLSGWPDEFTKDKVVFMSPHQLIDARRFKEVEHGLSRKSFRLEEDEPG